MAQKAEKPRKLEPVPKPNEKLFKDRIQAETTAIDELRAKIVCPTWFAMREHLICVLMQPV